jgi:tetratricopeptide (TPR) repeat protein
MERRPCQPETYQLLAALADRAGMLPEAELFYLECLKSPMTPAAEPLIYGSLLRILWKSQRYEAVIQTCRTGLKQAAVCNHVLLRADLARALGALGRWDEALQEAGQAVRDSKDEDRFMLRHLRVRLLTQAGKNAEAEAECLALLQEYPLPGEALEVRYLLSSVYSASKRLREADAELRECLKIDPTNPAVNNDLGYLWADQAKNLDEGEALIRKAIELDRKNRQNLLSLRPHADREFHDNACYIDSLGWVLYQRGQYDEAKKQLEYAASLPDGNDPVIWDHLGDVCAALGEPAGAIQAWRKALDFYQQGKRRKIDERYQALQKKLKRLETSRF